tara:strand:- start:99 stop:872 length:774 start_codon:yes stop_codon:yes gene_type:complete
MAEATELVNPEGPPGGGAAWNQTKTEEGRPEGIPEKFWNAEKGEVDSVSLLSSYTELEKKLGESTPSTDKEESPVVEAPPVTSEDSFDLGRYEDEYRDNASSLKEDTYAELKSKFGLDKTEVDKYINYRQSEADSFAQEIFNMAGGEESYKGLLGWASNNLEKAEVDRLNTILTTGEKDLVRVEVMKLNNKYRESVGAEPQSPVGGTTSTNKTGPKPFASIQEAVEARKDKRFDLDPAYRQQWEQRVGSSPFISKTT